MYRQTLPKALTLSDTLYVVYVELGHVLIDPEGILSCLPLMAEDYEIDVSCRSYLSNFFVGISQLG